MQKPGSSTDSNPVSRLQPVMADTALRSNKGYDIHSRAVTKIVVRLSQTLPTILLVKKHRIMVLIRTDRGTPSKRGNSKPFYQAQLDEHLVGDQELVKVKLLTIL